VLGWPGWRITGEMAAAYANVIGAIDSTAPGPAWQHAAQR
jgi:hypothetical protein